MRYYKFARHLLSLEPIQYDSGQVIKYTSAGYLLAELMIEKPSGFTYSQLVNKMNIELGTNFLIGWPGQLGGSQPCGDLIPSETGLGNKRELSVINSVQFTGWL